MEKLPEINRIADGVYLINEFDGANCYLAVGREKALLIDCGTGVCDLNAAVRRVTDLPLTVAATHGHVDHIGGAGQFDGVFVRREDCRALNRIQTAVPLRKLFAATSGGMKQRGAGAKDVRRYPGGARLIPFDGFRADLGGKTVEARHTPGHTRGSVAFVDHEDKIVFSGDNVCDALWLHLPGAASVERWLPSARWLYEMSGRYRVFWGHRTPELDREYIGQVVRWGEEILSSNKRNTRLPRFARWPDRPDGILYRTDNIFDE